MKELSVEEKARRYDEAIKRVEDIKTGKCETRFMFTEGLFEHIFPSLKESEDERIRKAIINVFASHKDYEVFFGVSVEDILAWLEAQGEQKPADKVEPKFHEGDLVVDNCGYVWKIEGILNQFYLLEGVEGGESRPTIEWVDKTFHKFNITGGKYWKPSDEQIGVIEAVINNRSFQRRHLDSLYEQLKKLREA